MTDSPETPRRPAASVVTETAEVIATRRVGAYQHLTVVAPEVAERARPGHFVVMRVGGEASSLPRPRAFWMHRATPSDTYGGTIELVVDPRGAGRRWVAQRSVHDTLELAGPLGRPFPLPSDPVGCVLVGGEYAAAPLLWLANELRGRGCAVEMVLESGASETDDRLFGVVEARRSADDVALSHRRESTLAALAERVSRPETSVAYAAGSLDLLRAVTVTAGQHGVQAQVAIETDLACGIGLCLSCVVPVQGNDGLTRMVRACTEGPTLRGDRIRWDAMDSEGFIVPADALGARGGPR